MDDASSGNKDGLPSDAMGKREHKTNNTQQNFICDKEGKNKELAAPKNATQMHATQNRRCKHTARNKSNMPAMRQLVTQMQAPWEYAQQKHIVYNIFNKKNSHSNRRTEDSAIEERVEALKEPAKSPQARASDGVLHHIGKEANAKYFVWWYGCTSVEDAVEPPSSIPHPFKYPLSALGTRKTAWRR